MVAAWIVCLTLLIDGGLGLWLYNQSQAASVADPAADPVSAPTVTRTVLVTAKPNVVRTVMIPVLLPSMASAFLLAFLTSFDELTIAIFVSGGLSTTLPKQMWDDMILQVNPTLAAVSTTLLLVVCLAVLALSMFRRERPSSP